MKVPSGAVEEDVDLVIYTRETCWMLFAKANVTPNVCQML
jgi:hypothetical protein